MSKNRLFAHILLDRSLSMSECRSGTVKAFNEYLKGLKNDGNLSGKISLTTFDSMGIDKVRDYEKLKKVDDLKLEEFVPRSATPLYDAIGKTISDIRNQKLRKRENVALVILTDGEENASQEYNIHTAKALIKECQKGGWLVIFLGANQDAFVEGGNLGVTLGNTMTYNTSNMGEIKRLR